MRYIIITICLVLTLVSCRQNEQGRSSVADPVVVKAEPLDEPVLTPEDSVIAVGKLILLTLKNKDWEGFSHYLSPTEGVRFSPYGYIDTSHHKKLMPDDFLAAIQRNWILTWGNYDGTGLPVKLTIPAYFKKFVYNADYLHAEKISYNKVIGTGNSLINLEKIYPGLNFIEYHFSGSDRKHQGMDWTSLRLVFKKEDGQYFLVGVIHDQWTI